MKQPIEPGTLLKARISLAVTALGILSLASENLDLGKMASTMVKNYAIARDFIWWPLTRIANISESTRDLYTALSLTIPALIMRGGPRTRFYGICMLGVVVNSLIVIMIVLVLYAIERLFGLLSIIVSASSSAAGWLGDTSFFFWVPWLGAFILFLLAIPIFVWLLYMAISWCFWSIALPLPQAGVFIQKVFEFAEQRERKKYLRKLYDRDNNRRSDYQPQSGDQDIREPIQFGQTMRSACFWMPYLLGHATLTLIFRNYKSDHIEEDSPFMRADWISLREQVDYYKSVFDAVALAVVLAVISKVVGDTF
jgi:hypothetical protein